MENPIILLDKPLPIFPCFGNKKPMTPHGYKDATTDYNKFTTLLKSEEFLIGVPTGEVSGFDVLDIDAAGQEWAKQLPAGLTREHRTRSGGSHFLFFHHPSLRNSASKIAPGVDVRADGGYIILWPKTGLEVFNYEVIADWPIDLILQSTTSKPTSTKSPLVVTPDSQELGLPNTSGWLSYPKCIEYLKIDKNIADIVSEISNRVDAEWLLGVTMHKTLVVTRYSRQSMYSIQSCAKSFGRIGRAEKGTRNDTLNAEAYALGRVMARSWLSPKLIISALVKGSMFNGLINEDGVETVIRTIISGLIAGLKNPYPDLE